MNSKFLHFLFVLTCAALIGLGPLRAQSPSGSSDGNGSAVTAPARHSDASHSAVAPSAAPDADSTRGRSDAQKASDAAIANDRGTAAPNEVARTRFSAGWIGLLGLLGLLGLVRRPRVERVEKNETNETLDSQRRPEDIRRAA